MRIPPDGRMYMLGMSRIAWEKGMRSLAMIPGTHNYAKEWAKDLRQAWEAYGGTIVAHEPANYYGKTDFYPYLTKVVQTNPDLLFLCGPSAVTANIIRQSRELGFKGRYLVCEQAKLGEMEKQVGLSGLNGAIGLCPMTQYHQFPWDVTASWRQEYQKSFKYLPNLEAANHYQMLIGFLRAMESADTIDDLDAIMNALKTVYPGSPGEPMYMLGVTRQVVVNSGYAISIENSRYTKPQWIGISVLPEGYYSLPGK